MSTPSEHTAAVAADPRTPAGVLADIATHRPDLRVVVAANPAAYPELVSWLRSLGDPAVVAAVDARGATPPVVPITPPPPPAAPAGSPVPAPPEAGWSAAGQPADPWGPGAQQQAGAWTPAATQPAQGYGPGAPATPVQQASWGAAPGAQQTAWSAPDPQQAGWGVPGPQQTDWVAHGEPTPPRRSRRRLWIAVGVVVALVLGGAAFAANALWFSKVGGASTPEAAARQLVEGIASKDLVSVYGVTSPAEIDLLTTAQEAFADHVPPSDDPDVARVLQAYVDALDLSLADLELSSETLEPGLARVTVTAGALTVDGDRDRLADATIDAARLLRESDVWSEAVASGAVTGADFPTDAEIRSAVTDAVGQVLPVTVTADDLAVPLAGGAPALPSVVVVEEGGSWYVSPYLTLADYLARAAGVERGSLPSPDLAGRYSTPESAAAGMVDGLTSYLSTGDTTELLATLPLGDRRALSLYGDFTSATDPSLREFQDTLEGLDVSATFSVRDTSGDVARLRLDTLEVSGEIEGSDVSVTIAGECVDVVVDGERVRACADDVPLLAELGLTDLSLVAVKEDGGWYVSPGGTWGDGFGLLAANIERLQSEGRLDDPRWIEENLGILADQLF